MKDLISRFARITTFFNFPCFPTSPNPHWKDGEFLYDVRIEVCSHCKGVGHIKITPRGSAEDE